LIADNIAQQLEKRIMFRRAMKRAMQNAMRLGAQGIKIMSSGRLNGIEIARREWYREGRVPLHTLRADLDYGTSEAQTTYGIIGIKVWVFKGEVIGHNEQPAVATAPASAMPANEIEKKRPQTPKRPPAGLPKVAAAEAVKPAAKAKPKAKVGDETKVAVKVVKKADKTDEKATVKTAAKKTVKTVKPGADDAATS
jgi:small subunit ribosomal protein S3